MGRLWLRWIRLVVIVLVLGAVFIRLGDWQIHRLEARRQNNAIVRANENRPVVDFPAVFSMTHTVVDADEWQRVRVTGTYDAAHQFQAMGRSLGDADGTVVVTPLRTSHGNVLVNRGFLARPAGQNDPTVLPKPPSGTVTVIGYVHRSEFGKPRQVTPVNNRMRLINAPMIGDQLPYPIVDGFLQLISSTPEQSGGLQPLGLPELSEGPHLSYAIQWFLFTAMALGAAVMFIRSDLRDRRREQRRLARAAAAQAEHPEPHGPSS